MQRTHRLKLVFLLAGMAACTEVPTSVSVEAPSYAAGSAGTHLTTAYVIGTALSAVAPPVVTPLATFGTLANGIALAPDGSTAYITILPQAVRAYQLSTGAVLAEGTLTSSDAIVGVAVTPDGQHVLVATPNRPAEAGLRILDAVTLQPVATVDGVGFAPHPIAVSPDGRYAYVGDRASLGFITAVDLSTRQVTGRVSVPGGGTEGPNSIAITQDGASLWVSQLNRNEVVKIDAATMTLTATHSTCTTFGCNGVGPKAIALSPDQTLIYVCYRSGVLEIRRTSDFGLVQMVGLGSPPLGLNGLAVSKDGQRVYVSASHPTGFVKILNAGGSVLTNVPMSQPFSIALFEPTPGVTPIGTTVTVQPVDQTPGAPAYGSTTVSLTFDQVTRGGITSVMSSSQGAPPPTGFRLGRPPVFYQINTTAEFSGTITVCINYDPPAFRRPARLQLSHDGGQGWQNVTTSNDPAAGRICGTVMSLSPFALFEEALAPVLTWGAPGAMVFGQPLSAMQLNATAAGVDGASLSGTFDYTPGAGTVLPVGPRTLAATFGPTDVDNYTTATKEVGVVVRYNTAVGHRFVWPVEQPAALKRSFRAGTTIPVIFRLVHADGVTPVATAQASIAVEKLSNIVTAKLVDDFPSLPPDAGNRFTYSRLERGIYRHFLGTHGFTTGTYRLTATLDDGSTIVGQVQIRAR